MKKRISCGGVSVGNWVYWMGLGVLGIIVLWVLVNYVGILEVDFIDRVNWGVC